MGKLHTDQAAAGGGIRILLDAETDAVKLVEAARLEAERSLERSRQRALAIEEMAQQRIAKVRNSTTQACAAIVRQVEADRDARLRGLQAGWRVDPSQLEKTVLEFARHLIGVDGT